MRTFRNLFLAILAPVILSACGQKGPLYLPESKRSGSEHNVSQVSSLSMSAASRNNTASANKTLPSK